MNVTEQLDRWVNARIIDQITAERILRYEKDAARHKPRWPAILAIGFGALMLCAGILLFVAAHWDDLSPANRFELVLGLVAIFHLAAGALGSRVPSIGVALHLVGTATLGAGIYLAGQIFNLQEHWPGGVMLWALGAVLACVALRQWPQALMAAMLIPWWLVGEWTVATEHYAGAWTLAPQGLLLLAILYLSVTPREPNRYLRIGLRWVGSLALLPCVGAVMFTGDAWWRYQSKPPAGLMLLGYAAAYLPVLALAYLSRKARAIPIFVSAFWVAVLGLITRYQSAEHNPAVYLWVALGACAFCYWGMRENSKALINWGCAIFALDVVTFYFSDVLDKLGRSMGLILLGAIFLAGGWVLNRLRSDMIARAAAGGAQ
ncbi:MAG: DUF2157 domain-containing protein [Acidobacteria bacterium]|nr:DUF2157 domain-containing protein [Acidobacteriota bacterium]